jgi:hypothetical protein
MTTVITDAQDIRGIHKDTRYAINIALHNGWRCQRQASGALRLIPPAGSTERSFRIPLSTKPYQQIKAFTNAVARTAKGEFVLMATLIRDEEPNLDLTDLADVDRGTIPVEVTVAEPKRKRDKPMPKIVSEGPWMARKAPRSKGGLLYPSKAVIQRTWSDGTIEYVCADPGCDWTADNPTSVARHYAGVHSRGQGQQAQPEPTAIDPDYTEPVNSRYTPTDRMVALVAEQVRLSLAAGMDADDMAIALLTWLHDRPDYQHTTRDIDLSPEAILDRIRVLVGRDPLAQQLEDAEKQMAEAAAELDQARAEILRLHNEREALRELLS